MPTYEYECEACGFRFERFQSMLDEPVRECPECNGSVNRLIGKGTGVIVKGNSAFSSRDRGRTCCGREERCEKPPCTDDQSCKRW
jgi:putative FmdB family regulatory protein